MDADTLLFFSAEPRALTLYQAFEEAVLSRFPSVRVKVCKTLISFSDRFGFAYVSLPRRKFRPRGSLLVTLGLPFRLDSPRVFQAVEPYPGRWTIHVVVTDESEIDEELMSFVAMSHDFSESK